MDKEKSTGRVRIKEYFGYACGEMGYTMENTIIASYMVMYFTNAVGIAPMVVGAMTMLCRFVDAFTDIGFGILADKTKTKMGKFRPWYMGSIIPTTIAFFLLFNVPGKIGSGSAMAVLWMYIFYILWGSFFGTVDYTWLNAHTSVATAKPTERRNFSTWRMWGTSLAGVIVGFLGVNLIIKFNMPLVMQSGGGSPMNFRHGYMMMALIIGVITLALFIISVVTTKERVVPPETQKGRFRDGFKAVKGNRLLVGALLVNVTMFILATYTTGLTSYFYNDYYGDPNVIANVMTIGGIIGLVFNTVVGPIINKKFRKEVIHIIALVGIVAAFLILFVAPIGNIVVFIIGWGLFQCMVPLGACMFYRTLPDAVDYGEWKNGVYAPGLLSSLSSFIQKIGMGVASLLFTAVLTFVGYDAALPEQTAETLQGIHIAYFVGPVAIMCCTLIGYFIVLSVKKGDILQMRKELAEKRGVEYDEKNALM